MVPNRRRTVKPSVARRIWSRGNATNAISPSATADHRGSRSLPPPAGDTELHGGADDAERQPRDRHPPLSGRRRQWIQDPHVARR